MNRAVSLAVAAALVAGASARAGAPLRGTRGARRTEARWAAGRDLAPLTVRGARRGRVVLGRAGRKLVAAEAGHSVLVVGPTQSHKTSGLVIPALLEWQGPVLAASVKADLVRHSVGWRRRRGEVWLFDPAGATGLRAAPWTPLSECGDWGGARKVAHALTEAGRAAGTSLTDSDFWYATAAKLLAPLCMAAALSGRTMADVVRWVDEQDDLEPADALFAAGAHDALQALRASTSREGRQRSAVYSTAETVIEAFADPAVTSAGVPAGHRGAIDPWRLVGGEHTLYLCAPAHDQRRLRPLFSALATAVLDAAFARSARAGEPLDPPLLVLLDEAANIAPLAELDALASTAAGHGIQLVTVWQDLAQLSARYGTRASTVVNNHRVKIFLSGIADPQTLEHASTLVGEREERHRATTLDGRGARTTSESAVTRRLLPPDALRRVTPGTAVAVSGHYAPLRLRLRPWWRDRELRRRAGDLGPPPPGADGEVAVEVERR